ncbi:D-amino acid aminotransferase [Legionella oakridgensis]|uniref:Aminodeoxychorismate lyase n=2 Tax=Legionella oakridgensis TaxID=29423 RepID=W0BBG1_9GAMM|nr:D-amino acid aminotransferase [Legionella oakridgensis]AHE67200.1 branched-chain amino acid aminotransferase/4-amino-4-deoxychorismate lyase [Legionella oakridgensis ATCC 33761 = DSM 21215]ETO93164.1 branched-chain amino acid aminotransferase/4-amino-4-deoxychorismate lyase [Legionella oakridgensis RV-2-2007]KTD38001.1 D-alanine-aminotransferase [Legionella oakridgensis]STY20277.1 D-alanine transaminase [Legionella longbeachae]
MKQIVYINGEYVAAADAKISVFDRGLLFGDSVYEVIPVYQGEIYFYARHMARLASSLDSIKMAMPSVNWRMIFQELIKQNGSGDLQIYLQITRGNQGKRHHDLPKDPVPTIIAFTLHVPYPTYASKKLGIHAHLVNDIRWLRCDIKTTSMLANILLNNEAVSAGAQTAILVRDGFVTEGSASNIFIVDSDGVIRTSPKNNLCLPGITREIVIELIKELNWPLREETISQEALINAQEVWLTSTTKEVFPITHINNQTIGIGYGGRYWQQLETKFQQSLKQKL